MTRMGEPYCVFRRCEYILIKLLEENPDYIKSLQKLNTLEEIGEEYLKVLSNEESQQSSTAIPLLKESLVTDPDENSSSVCYNLDEAKSRLLEVFEEPKKLSPYCSYLKLYLTTYNFTELHLDGVFHHDRNPVLPDVIFHCTNVRVLSLCYNKLQQLPVALGRLHKLEKLALTNNRLENSSIPYTLTFCSRLKTLLLDNNLLDGLPGFLLDMPNLSKVHRHGNNNYFKATFMWYHTDVNGRVLPQPGQIINLDTLHIALDSLQVASMQTLLAHKINFFYTEHVPEKLQNLLAQVYPLFNICGNCNTARLKSYSGYKVFTFKNPYLGNSCVPFVHWACCKDCAMCIEIPARVEQMVSAYRQDREYAAYIEMLQKQIQNNEQRPQSCAIL